MEETIAPKRLSMLWELGWKHMAKQHTIQMRCSANPGLLNFSMCIKNFKIKMYLMYITLLTGVQYDGLACVCGVWSFPCTARIWFARILLGNFASIFTLAIVYVIDVSISFGYQVMAL